MVTVRFPKPEVVLSQPWTEISHRNKFGRQTYFHLCKPMPSLNMNPEVHFELYGRHLEKSVSRHHSAADRPISTKFGRQIELNLLKQIPSLNLDPKYISVSIAAISKNRYDVITPPPIVRLLLNLVCMCKMTCRWLYIRLNRNRK